MSVLMYFKFLKFIFELSMFCCFPKLCTVFFTFFCNFSDVICDYFHLIVNLTIKNMKWQQPSKSNTPLNRNLRMVADTCTLKSVTLNTTNNFYTILIKIVISLIRNLEFAIANCNVRRRVPDYLDSK